MKNTFRKSDSYLQYEQDKKAESEKTKFIVKLIALVAVTVLMLTLFPSCKKKTVTPVEQEQIQQVATVNSSPLDTSKSGSYKMVWSSASGQLNSSLVLKMNYKSYKYYSHADTTDKIILYSFASNNGNKGELKVSAGVTYKNEGTNKSQPYIETRRDTIRNGFIECSTLWLGTGSFNSDTLILKFGYKASGANTTMICKYKKV